MAERRGLRIESLVTPDGTLEVSLAEREVPEPGPDEVIVRVEAAPINPSDVAKMFAFGDVGRARAGGTVDRPTVSLPLSAGAMAAARTRVGRRIELGTEGAGTVVATGSGDAARALAGRLVSAPGPMYAQYRLVAAADCVPLPEGATAATGAAAFVNPLTALGMVETMRAEGHAALVHTAAASSLGRMLLRVCLKEGVPLVNVVRSPQQARLLRDAGAEHVCDSGAEDFESELTAALAATGATIAFDAVAGGSLADRMLACMERAVGDGTFQMYGSEVHKQVYLYGTLNRAPTELRRTYGLSWGVGGWLLFKFLRQAGAERVAELRRTVVDGLETTFATHFSRSITPAEALGADALQEYARPTTGTKFLLVPHG